MTTAAAWAFLAVWFCCHLIYPFWFPLGGSLLIAYSLFIFLGLLGLGLLRFLHPVLESGAQDDELPSWAHLPQDPVLWCLLALAAAIRLYPMTLPVHLWQAGDEAVHMGFPALPFKLWNRTFPVPMFTFLWAFLAIALWTRKIWIGRAKNAVLALARLKIAALSAAVPAAALYFGIAFRTIRDFSTSGYPSLPRDLLRAPPLGHWIHGLFYALFGVSNLTGRLPEFLFSLAGAFLIYSLALEFRSRTTARIAAVLYLFLPSLGYYAMRGSQTHGELFFALWTAYSFARWSRSGNPRTLYWAVFAVSAGCLYRYTVLPLAPLLAAMVLAAHWIEPSRLRLPQRTAVECSVLALAMTLPWTISYFCYKLRPYEFGAGHTLLEGLIEPALSLPAGVSWPIAALMALCFFAALWRPKDRLQWYLLAWFAAYYLFVSADFGWDVRLTLPLYPPLILWSADGIAAVAGQGRLGLCAGVALMIYLLSIGTWLPMPQVQPEFNLRRSLETEYVPLNDAAQALSRLPEGTRVLSVDCGRGCFSFYLAKPEAIRWAAVDSRTLRSLDDLSKLCRDSGSRTVVYAAGTVEAFGSGRNPDLFTAFVRDDPRFIWRADFKLGGNRIAIKDFVGGGPAESK